MNDISELIPFSRLRQISARGVFGSTDRSLSSDNLLIYKGLVDKKTRYYEYIFEHYYFPLNQRCFAKLNYEPGMEDSFYEFTVFDLWSEKEM
jgi:hypothetical protein